MDGVYRAGSHPAVGGQWFGLVWFLGCGIDIFRAKVDLGFMLVF